jgi:hypothetical protein
MAELMASCPRHGKVTCDPRDIFLYLRADQELRHSFPCGPCGRRVDKPAQPGDMPVLTALGVRLSVSLPAPPLTYDDLLAFHLWLEAHDHLVAQLP